MVPFIHNELKVKGLIEQLMLFFVKSDILEKCKNSHQLKEIDLSKTENVVSQKEVEMGFGLIKVRVKMKSLKYS